MKKLVGIATGAIQNKFGDKKAIEIAYQIGADSVDLELFWVVKRIDALIEEQPDKFVNRDEAIISYCKELKATADANGIIIGQTHARGGGFRNNEKADDSLVEIIRQDLLATHILGAPVCVVHNATSIFLGPKPDPELMHKLSYGLFSRTLPFAKEYGVKIATETFGDAVKFEECDFFGYIDEFMKTYEEIKGIEEYKDYFTTCVDTGHSNKAMRFGNPTPADVIRRIGSDISVLHLNDNDTLTDQHKIPMTGVIDWDDVFNALDEIGYSGIYNLELNLVHFGEDFTVETAEFAIKVLRYMLKTRYGED